MDTPPAGPSARIGADRRARTARVLWWVGVPVVWTTSLSATIVWVLR